MTVMSAQLWHTTEGTIAATNMLARHEGILLDPVYSGKGMAGLIAAASRLEILHRMAMSSFCIPAVRCHSLPMRINLDPQPLRNSSTRRETTKQGDSKMKKLIMNAALAALLSTASTAALAAERVAIGVPSWTGAGDRPSDCNGRQRAYRWQGRACAWQQWTLPGHGPGQG